MIFTIIKLGLKGKSLYNDPKNFAEGAVKETALSVILFPVIFAILFLVLLGVFSFSTILGGPYVIAKILFWIFFFVYSLMSIPLIIFWKMVRRVSKQAGKGTEKVFVHSELKK